jgi:hypothetical protein
LHCGAFQNINKYDYLTICTIFSVCKK